MNDHTGITVYGAIWCGDGKRTKKFLGEQRVHDHWVDVEGATAALAIREYLEDGLMVLDG